MNKRKKSEIKALEGSIEIRKRIARKCTGITAVICMLLVLGGCSGAGADTAAKEEDSSLKVISTIFPSYDFARQIAGEAAEVRMLLKPGEEVHSYEPTPQDIIDIRNCDIFIYTGGENDVWVDQILENLGDAAPETIRMVDLVETYEEEIVEGMQEEKGDEHDHGENADHDGHDHEEAEEHEEEADEHVWTSPKNAMEITAAIADAMEKKDPDNAATYAENAKNYIAEIEKVDEEFAEIMKNAKRKTLVFGDRFPIRYFAEEFGLEYYAAFAGCSSDAQPSAKTLAFLINKVREEEIPAVFSIEFSNGAIAEAICETTGAEHLTFETCHNVTAKQMEAGATYVSLMRENEEAVKAALY